MYTNIPYVPSNQFNISRLSNTSKPHTTEAPINKFTHSEAQIRVKCNMCQNDYNRNEIYSYGRCRNNCSICYGCMGVVMSQQSECPYCRRIIDEEEYRTFFINRYGK